MRQVQCAQAIDPVNERVESEILLVEDEQAIRDMVCMALRRAGYRCRSAADVPRARSLLADRRPELLLLDWMLPGTSGLQFARELRHDPATCDLPIIMLTARDQEDDRVAGLEAGADDYLGKPFSTRELLARIDAVLRRARGYRDGERLRAGRLEMNLARMSLTADGEEIRLAPTEFRLLRFLMRHPERVFSRAQLLDNAWGGNVYVEERTVDVHVRRLRRQLEPHGCDGYIQTVRGAGYRFSAGEP